MSRKSNILFSPAKTYARVSVAALALFIGLNACFEPSTVEDDEDPATTVTIVEPEPDTNTDTEVTIDDDAGEGDSGSSDNENDSADVADESIAENELTEQTADEATEDAENDALTDVSSDNDSDNDSSASLVAWIDTHVHPMSAVDGSGTAACMTEECLADTITRMDESGMTQAVFLSMPSLNALGTTDTDVLTSVNVNTARFVYGGGGSTLNGLIESVDRREEEDANGTNPMTDAQHAAMIDNYKDKMTVAAQTLIANGAKVFGEMAALHLSAYDEHPFEEVEPDHELFLHLAELAVQYGVPIDLHMSAVEGEDMTTPTYFTTKSPTKNPATLAENISDLENLLDHNTEAKIVWVHAGWDNTGEQTVALMQRLLDAHANLYLQLHIILPGDFGGAVVTANTPLNNNGELRAEWLEFITAYPDRFVMGSDAFVLKEHDDDEFALQQQLLQQLPADVAKKVGTENAQAIYNLE